MQDLRNVEMSKLFDTLLKLRDQNKQGIKTDIVPCFYKTYRLCRNKEERIFVLNKFFEKKEKSQLQILEWMIWRRFQNKKDIEEAIQQKIWQIVKLEKAEVHEDMQGIDYSFIFECCFDSIPVDVDMYFLNDNGWNYYITEINYEKI